MNRVVEPVLGYDERVSPSAVQLACHRIFPSLTQRSRVALEAAPPTVASTTAYMIEECTQVQIKEKNFQRKMSNRTVEQLNTKWDRN